MFYVLNYYEIMRIYFVFVLNIIYLSFIPLYVTLLVNNLAKTAETLYQYMNLRMFIQK